MLVVLGFGASLFWRVKLVRLHAKSGLFGSWRSQLGHSKAQRTPILTIKALFLVFEMCLVCVVLRPDSPQT